MNIFTNTIKNDSYSSKIFDEYFGGLNIGFFDIETTGLSPNKCKVILAGLAVPSDDELEVIQFFADDPSEEPELLRALLDELDKLDMVITYNGRSFDMPFVKTRCDRCHIHMNRGLPYNLDLLRAIKYHSPLNGMLPNLKQKTVENFLGLWETRADEISGADSIELYYIYAAEKDEKLRDVILLHNHDDIVQLSKVIRILDRCNLHSYVFRDGLPSGSLIAESVELRKKSLCILGSQRTDFTDGRFYDIPEILFDSSQKSFAVRVPLIYQEGLVLCDMKTLPFNLDVSIEDYVLLVNNNEVLYENANLLIRALLNHASILCGK